MACGTSRKDQSINISHIGVSVTIVCSLVYTMANLTLPSVIVEEILALLPNKSTH
ncbi:hypothetical protein Tsubulata_019191 [Turnera subulata]|uniref:Uncharacterized protein n=1 Tax=Turnera subulata TaxID=218843 RepID=A0A9Q0JFG2_9ROSI|nr:hypothetical protein Tsubulata_019191 [Turnera subulata]